MKASLKPALKKIAQAVKKNKTFFLSGHRKPDGDTVASELAMASLLKRLKKKVDIYNFEPVPQSLLYLPGARSIKTSKKVNKKYDVAIIFECFDSNRMGNVIDLKTQAKTVINIDHHLMHTHFGDINLINTSASSNSEQLYYLFNELKLPIRQNEAASLYSGIMADTGRFMHSNTNSETLHIASKLLESGIQVHHLTEKIFGTKSFPAIKLLGFCLDNLKLSHGGRISSMKIRQSDFIKLHSSDEDCEEIVNYGLLPPTALMSFLIRESENKKFVKVSLRSRRYVNVCELAKKFGGGGHKYASGCKIDASVDQAQKMLLTEAQKMLR